MIGLKMRDMVRLKEEEEHGSLLFSSFPSSSKVDEQTKHDSDGATQRSPTKKNARRSCIFWV